LMLQTAFARDHLDSGLRLTLGNLFGMRAGALVGQSTVEGSV
jgi:hypothetical protein